MNAAARLIVCLLLIAGGGAIGHRQMMPARHSALSSAEVESLAASDSPLASLAARSGWRVAGALRGRLNGRRVVIAWAEGARRCVYTLAVPQGRQGSTVVFGIGSDGPLRISDLGRPSGSGELRSTPFGLLPPSPGEDLAGQPAYPGQKRALVFESDDRRLGVGVYRVAAPLAMVKGFFDDQFRAQGWRDLLETRRPKWSLREEPLLFQSPSGDVCLMTFAPIAGTRETGYLVCRWQTLEGKP